jgi:hypothetical protein
MSRARWLAAGAAVAGISALALERALTSLPPEDRPASGPVRARVEIEAPIKRVWDVVADIPGQVRWMPEMKRVVVLTPGPVREGTVGEATVRIMGIAVTDRVTITTFRAPEAFAIEHEGLVGGRGHITLRPGLDGTTTIVEWEEFLVPPWLPAVGWLMGRPVISWLYRRDLFLLRDVVEADLAASGGGAAPGGRARTDGGLGHGRGQAADEPT